MTPAIRSPAQNLHKLKAEELPSKSANTLPLVKNLIKLMKPTSQPKEQLDENPIKRLSHYLIHLNFTSSD